MGEREAPAGVSHGQVLFVHEILARGVTANNLSVRVTGCLAHVDRAASSASVVDPRSPAVASVAALAVDTSQVMEQNFRDDELVRIIGEMCVTADRGGAPLLRARVLSNVDGLDLEVYERTVLAKRAFEAEVAAAGR